MKQDLRDFVLEWDMVREADSGPTDRAIVVWHVYAPDPRSRKAFFVVGHCPEVGRKYHFRLEVKGASGKLLRDGREVEGRPTVYRPDPPDLYSLIYDSPGAGEGKFGLPASSRFANNGIVQEASTFFPSSGFAILRQPPDSGGLPDPGSLAVSFNCGPYGGGHGHPDKLGIVLYASGRHWLPDFGSCGYDSPLKGEWTAQTVSHNTVVVDEASQYPSGPHNPTWPVDTDKKRAIGSIDLFHAGPAMRIVHGWSDSVYDGVHLERTLIHLGQSLVDVFRAKSPHEHTYDYVLHVEGELQRSNLALTPQPGPIGEKCGYQHITEVRHGIARGVWESVWRGGDHLLRLFALPAPGTEAYLGTSITTSENSRMPALFMRRKARQTVFVTVMIPSSKGIVEDRSGEGYALIRIGDSASRIYFRPVPGVFTGDLGVVMACGKALRQKTGSDTVFALVNGTRMKAGYTEIKSARPVTLYGSRQGKRWVITPGTNTEGKVRIGSRSLTIRPGKNRYVIEEPGG